MTRDEPTWVPRLAVLAAHFDQLREHGGKHGLRGKGTLLDAALARPLNRFAYDYDCDLADLAAAYAFGITKTSHPFNDGNKRAGFVIASIFLDLNGYALNHLNDDVVTTMLAVADGSLTEEGLAAWFRAGMERP